MRIQSRKPEPHGQRTEGVLACIGILTRQAACNEAGEVAVNLAWRHAAGRSQLPQRDRRLSAREMVENLTGDLDRLDASAFFGPHPGARFIRTALPNAAASPPQQVAD